MVTLALIAYTTDGVLRGAVELDHQRLADLLAEQGTLQLSQVAVQAHDDGDIRKLGRAEVAQEELPVIVATGPQGDPERRVDMSAIAVTATVGRYRIMGRVHVPRGADLAAVERATWVAITGAVIAYDAGGRVQVHLHEVLLVNRAAIRTIGRCAEMDYEQEREQVFHHDAQSDKTPIAVMRFARPVPPVPPLPMIPA